MPQKTSVAEKEFEARCEGALVLLRMRWEIIQALINRQMTVVSQDRKERVQSLATRVGTQDTESFARLSAELLQKWTKRDEAFFADEWERAKRFVTELFGADAVEAALKLMKPNLKAN